MSANGSTFPTSPLMASPSSLTWSPFISSPSLLSPSPRSYKNKDKDLKQLRRRRSETAVVLRKQKKDSDSDRRRNISAFDWWSEDELIDEEEDIDLNAMQILNVLKTEEIFSIPSKYIRRLRKIIPKGFEIRRPENRELKEQIFSSDVLTKLLNCLKLEDCPQNLLQDVVALMAQLCSGDKEETLLLVNYKLIDLLLPLLAYDNFAIVEQSVLALAYIWNSCEEMCKLLNKTQFLRVLVQLIDSETTVSPSKYSKTDGRLGLLRALSWALFLICQNQDLMSYKLSLHLIPYFVKLLNYCDTEVKTNVLKTLSVTTERVVTITEDENCPILKVVQSVVSNEVLFSSIISSLSINNEDIVLNAIRIIANIASWGESYAQIIIQAKALESFGVLLTHQSAQVQKEAAFTASNITAGNSAQIKAVIDAKLMPLIVELLYMGDYATQSEASHVLLNISAIGSKEQILYIMNLEKTVANMDVIDAMASLLTSTDAAVLMTCLNFYNNLLNFAKRFSILKPVVNRCELSVLFHLESLQNHKNSQIAVLATHLMDEYFSSDNSFEEEMLINTSLTTEDTKQMETNITF